ncbi:D-serine deaminase, pyridoxal phosphate-dependent [Loktanella fryxellensis]|uniref:D-serine deaminase, pyridoxal phosphate-dependent n=1 Tax=Loktanella fryxellensis TaxID=245187 RepID=A0A1H8GYJ5_9RHOB|nr:D-TA family PLP-dependent enzyme [Loktanella fryxellensis]SEN48577.1 D-serine deaminase, pyridoxal phosphate-dependent [Loktanella fryxellensis]
MSVPPHFPWPAPGTSLSDIITPMAVIDEDRLSANIARTQSYMNAHGLAFRPHIKSHKIPDIAHQQTAAGAVGLNCQKISEAEVFADAGFTDILITYNILGPVRLARLAVLHARVATLRVVADSAVTVAGLAATFTDPVRPLGVLVECDTGAARCGVQTPAAAVALAQSIAAHPGLRCDGLLTYPPVGGAVAVEAFLQDAMARMADLGLPCPVRSNGGSPDLFSAHLVPSATEHRAGTYVYNDRAMLRAGACGPDDLAMQVLTTVVSRPTADRMVLDAGSKALTSDLLGFADHGLIPALPGARIVTLSEEHGVVDLTGCTGPLPQVGDQIAVVPNHTCVVSNLCDRMVFHRGGRVTRVLAVAARGTVW